MADPTKEFQDVLTDASRTQFAAAKERMRFALNGVLLKVEGDSLELVATDGRRLARDGLSQPLLFRGSIHRRHRRLSTKALGGIPHGVRYRSIDPAGSTPHLLSSHYRCGHYSRGQLFHRLVFVPGIETRAGARAGQLAGSRGRDTLRGRSPNCARNAVVHSIGRPITLVNEPSTDAIIRRPAACAA